MAGEIPRVFAKAFVCGPVSNPEDMKGKLLASNPGFLVQATEADVAGNEFYVEMLAAQTFRAESSGNLLAKKPEIDLLLRLAGTTQIGEAIKNVGARQGAEFLLLAAGPSEVRGCEKIPGRELPRRKLSRAELGRIEKAALLNVRRY